MQQDSTSSPSSKTRLKIGNASEYLGVSIDTLRRWEKKGKVSSYRSPGGHRYFLKADLDKVFGKKYQRHIPSKEEEVKTPKETIESNYKESYHTKPQPSHTYAVVEQIKDLAESEETPQTAPLEQQEEKEIEPETPVEPAPPSILEPAPPTPSPTPPAPEQPSRQHLEEKAKVIIDSHQPKYPEVKVTPTKKDTSFTKIAIFSLIFFVIVDIVLVTIYLLSSRPLLSPIP